MEAGVLRSPGRARKRRRKDVHNVSLNRSDTPEAKKRAVETRSKALVGRFVKKEFEGSGVYLGKIVCYDSGLYRVDYEDGDCEDLDGFEIREFLVSDSDLLGDWISRKKKLDELTAQKSVELPETLEANVLNSPANGLDRVEQPIQSELSCGPIADINADSSSDSCEYAKDEDLVSEVEHVVPPPQLPESSGNIAVPEEYISHLLSVYSFLRSFSIRLFLSPFTLDDLVGSLNCVVRNTLLDAIHVALLRALRRHLEAISSDGSDLASKCLRCIEWNLLDTLTWPVYLVQYLTIMGYTDIPEWKGFYRDVFSKEYYMLSVGSKLRVLQILCDDIIDSAELRAEIDMREESEYGPDSETFTNVPNENGPRRVHPRYSKTSACKEIEAMEIISENHEMKSSCNSSKVYTNADAADADADGNGDECRLCGMDGTLLCCDGCPSAYHSRCIGVNKMFIPEGSWFCPECTINKIGPTITKGTLLKGAEIFGVDSYQQVFLGTCNHLLILKTSANGESCLRSYHQHDIPKVLQALCSSQHTSLYSEISQAIIGYWQIPENVFSLTEMIKTGIDSENHKVLDANDSENFESTVTDSNADDCLTNQSFVTCTSVNISNQIKGSDHLLVGGRKNQSPVGDYSYTGLFFKPQAYINNYTHGDFAASAAANLAVLSSEENLAPDSQTLDPRKAMSVNVLMQVKAFSLAAIRFFWPNLEKKLVEIPRERCGWCLSCKAPISSKKGCLLNAAALNAIKGVTKILSSLSPVRTVERSIAAIATYILYMEASLGGLIVGPFLSASYRKHWRKQVEQASTCSALKPLLLELEENIRIIAFSGDWSKLVDNGLVEPSISMSGSSIVATTHRRGPGRRRKQFPPPEIATNFCNEKLSDFLWWRGGKLSKVIFQKGILPFSIVKKAARQAGFKKIDGLHYAEGSEIPKTSRQFVWKAAVDVSRNPSQLALQVRYLDFHIRWSDLVRPEQTFHDGKGTETEASAFRNAFIFDKRTVENKVMYGILFGNQKHLSTKVMKNVTEMEQSQDGDRYWFLESRVPLYLIKEYEEKVKEELLLPSVKKNVLSKRQRSQLKAARRDIFSYLVQKRDNVNKISCVSCQMDVLLSIAVKCGACEGYCHEVCTVSSTAHTSNDVELPITCLKCYRSKVHCQTENSSGSPTSPLPLQEYQNTSKANKLSRQKSQQVAFSRSTDTKAKVTACHSVLATKAPPRKLCSWGIIWKKKDSENTGVDFRLKNILLRGTPDMNWLKPVCYLCHKPYNPDLMYIHCETCQHWYHAEAIELEESKIFDVQGFKCCRCRRIRSPLCPYKDPDSSKPSSKKQQRTRSSKNRRNREIDCVSLTGSDYEPSTPSLVTKEELFIDPDDPLLFSLSKVEQTTDRSDGDLECNNAASGPVPQKLPVRRQVKHEKDLDDFAENSLPQIEVSEPFENNPTDEGALSPRAEWNLSGNGFDEEMMFDYADLNYEDMEFEPQTYFSFTELLASDEANGDEKLGNGENDQQEVAISVEPAVDVVMPCTICLLREPAPELSCQICGTRMHTSCVPWADQLSSSCQDSWQCPHCREWT